MPFEEAKALLREWVPVLDADDAKTFNRKTLEWPQGVETGELLPRLDGLDLNPQRKIINDAARQEIEDIVGRYNDDLEALAIVSVQVVQDALYHYYDSNQAIWFRDTEPEPDYPSNEGLPRSTHSRRLQIRMHGWVCRIVFQSRDYPEVEAHLKAVNSLKTERLNAVRNHIETL